MRSLSQYSTNPRVYKYAQNEIIQQAVDKYFELKQERAQEGNTSDVTQPIKNVVETEENK